MLNVYKGEGTLSQVEQHLVRIEALLTGNAMPGQGAGKKKITTHVGKGTPGGLEPTTNHRKDHEQGRKGKRRKGATDDGDARRAENVSSGNAVQEGMEQGKRCAADGPVRLERTIQGKGGVAGGGKQKKKKAVKKD